MRNKFGLRWIWTQSHRKGIVGGAVIELSRKYFAGEQEDSEISRSGF